MITNAIIYKPANVDRVGESRALGTSVTPARRSTTHASPSVRSSQADGGGDPFLFVVNHFKSKGSAGPTRATPTPATVRAPPTTVACCQATALRDWVADDCQDGPGIDAVVPGR